MSVADDVIYWTLNTELNGEADGRFYEVIFYNKI